MSNSRPQETRMNLIKRCGNLVTARRNLGTLPTVHYALQRLRDKIAPTAGISVRSQFAQFPLWCRHGTSDTDVFGQIFVYREYRCLDDVSDAKLIIDCGANVGFSAAYFLTRFPGAHVIAIEPDEDNFNSLARNLAPYSPRLTALHKGIWSRPAGLVISEAPFGDNREWAVTVRETRDDERPTLEAITIPSLIPEGGRVSILKVDIEGSEREVFSGNCDWLDAVDNLVIELHGADCEVVFKRAIAGRGFKRSRYGELHVCVR